MLIAQICDGSVSLGLVYKEVVAGYFTFTSLE